jgi:trans-2-enoyl-CoA reductase
MKAARHDSFGKPEDVIACVDVPDPPPPGPGEISVEMVVMSINPADLLTIEGRYGVTPALPHIPGAEGVGRVAALGPGVEGLAVGELVAPLAGSAWVERMTVRASAVIPLPAGVDPMQAAMIKANPATAEIMLTDLAPLQAGDWLIQNAANSAVGQYLCRLAALRGIRTVNIVRRVEAGRVVSEHGGDVVLVHDGSRPDRLAQECARATKGAPIRLALDAVGGPATNALAACLAEGGKLVTYGLLSGAPCEIDADHLVFRGIVHSGFWLAPWFRSAGRERIAELYRRLVPLIADGTLAAEVAATYPLEQIKEAIAHAARGGRGGKVLLLNGA